MVSKSNPFYEILQDKDCDNKTGAIHERRIFDNLQVKRNSELKMNKVCKICQQNSFPVLNHFILPLDGITVLQQEPVVRGFPQRFSGFVA